MNLTQVPISMIDTASGDAGKVLVSNGSTLSWVASSGNTSAKAWVNFNGTLASPSAVGRSYNVSSITKNAAGDYTINFTNALADVNYSVSGSCQGSNMYGVCVAGTFNSSSTLKSTTQLRINTASAGGITDTTDTSVQIFGN